VALGQQSVSRARAELRVRLEARRPEIEQAILNRIEAVSDFPEGDPEYLEGLRAAVSAAVDYAVDGVAHGEDRAAPVPAPLLAQARTAARREIGLDTILRRYFTGYTLLGDFLVQEADDAGLLKDVALKRLLRSQGALFDRLVVAVSEEHVREQDRQLGSPRERRAQRIRRLLAGELLDTAEFAYDFDGHHLGLACSGADAEEAIRGLTAPLDGHLFLVELGEDTVWSWLGSRVATDPAELREVARSHLPTGLALGIGEPSAGLRGWRLTHQQARAALMVARGTAGGVARYLDVAPLASMLQDELLVVSLRELYLAPLERERDRGEVARRTLRAYFAAGRNVSSAAAALGVSRQAVGNRIRAIEDLLARPLDACAMDLEAALRIEAHAQARTQPIGVGLASANGIDLSDRQGASEHER
jgi:hypothetical protein